MKKYSWKVVSLAWSVSPLNWPIPVSSPEVTNELSEDIGTSISTVTFAKDVEVVLVTFIWPWYLPGMQFLCLGEIIVMLVWCWLIAMLEFLSIPPVWLRT